MIGEGPKIGKILKIIADGVDYRATEEKGDGLWKLDLLDKEKSTEKSTKLELIDNSLLNNIEKSYLKWGNSAAAGFWFCMNWTMGNCLDEKKASPEANPDMLVRKRRWQLQLQKPTGHT